MGLCADYRNAPRNLTPVCWRMPDNPSRSSYLWWTWGESNPRPKYLLSPSYSHIANNCPPVPVMSCYSPKGVIVPVAHVEFGRKGRIRTCDRPLPKRDLYQPELLSVWLRGMDSNHRQRDLTGRCSTTELPHNWLEEVDSNHRPAAYRAAALPLSYPPETGRVGAVTP